MCRQAIREISFNCSGPIARQTAGGAPRIFFFVQPEGHFGRPRIFASEAPPVSRPRLFPLPGPSACSSACPLQVIPGH